MTTSTAFIAITIVVLALAATLAFLTGRQKAQNRLTPLAGLAFSCIIAGIIFGEDRYVGYGLMAVGVILAIADMFHRSQTR